MKSQKTVVREVSPDLHLITPELHQVSPEFFFKKWENANAVPFSCRLKVSPELGISPAGSFSLRIAKRQILGFRLKKKDKGRPRYIYNWAASLPITQPNPTLFSSQHPHHPRHSANPSTSMWSPWRLRWSP